ncbi:MAG TPA: hypothetical protein PK177_18420 [Burkholderiaceae bacterium]|nr:hypothetical protein [Burkholderiaceae bacterium]
MLFLIVVPGSTLIAPIAWWLLARRSGRGWTLIGPAHRNESMTDNTENASHEARATALVARASEGWQRNLHDFFDPLIAWISDARRQIADPDVYRRDAFLGKSSSLVDLEHRERDWERSN